MREVFPIKKVILTIVFLLSILSIITSCSISKIKDDPEISLKFNVTGLTDDEFQSVGTKGIENATKNDFRNIEFTLDVQHSNKISNRKIEIPDLKKISNSHDIDRYWFGESYSQDNMNEKFAKYGDKFVLYTKDLDEQVIKDIFNSAEVKVYWTNSKYEDTEKVFKLGEVIQFK